MKQQPKKQSLEQLQSLITFAQRYLVIGLIVLFGALYGYILFQSDSLSKKEPTEAAVAEEIKTTVRPKIDPTVAETMQSLEEQNVDVKAIFNEARENPFTE